MDREKAMELITAYADGELNEAGKLEAEELLAASAEMRAELEALRKMKALTGSLRFAEPEQEVWNMYWANVYNRIERGVGWILLSLGAIVLLAWGAWHFVEDFLLNSNEPLVVKAGLSAAILGAIVLLVSVLRERLFIRRKERYEEVVR